MGAPKNSNTVIPAKAGIQLLYLICLWVLPPALRGTFSIGLDSRLRGNDEFLGVS